MFKSLLFLVVLAASCAARAAERPYVISGFDDVLRQAENTGLWVAGLKMFEPDQTFTGMPELYTEISNDEADPRFTLVSATSTLFHDRIDEFLDRSGFPSRRLDLRNWLTEPSIEDFKIGQIREILNQYPNRQFIVIFDNSDPSLSMAETIHEEFPDRILAVYLRQVVQKTLPASAHPFYSAFDIAIGEYRAGRLDLSAVRAVANAIVNEKTTEKLFPSYAVCPKNEDPCQGIHGEAAMVCFRVKAHIQGLCRSGR